MSIFTPAELDEVRAVQAAWQAEEIRLLQEAAAARALAPPPKFRYKAMVHICGGPDAAGGGCGGYLGTYQAGDKQPGDGTSTAGNLLTASELDREDLQSDDPVLVSFSPCSCCRRYC